MTLDRNGKRDKHEFLWRGLALHLGQRRQPVLELVADETYPRPVSHPISGRLDEHSCKPDTSEGCRVRARSLFAGAAEAGRGLLQPRS